MTIIIIYDLDTSAMQHKTEKQLIANDSIISVQMLIDLFNKNRVKQSSTFQSDEIITEVIFGNTQIALRLYLCLRFIRFRHQNKILG